VIITQSMTFYIAGLGLNEESLTKEIIEVINKSSKVYIETYTVEYPYDLKVFEKSIGKKLLSLDRGAVESEKFLEEAKKKEVTLLVYGSPLFATTHYSLILKCIKEKIPYKVLQNASIKDAVGAIGLQIYKYGKTTSMPTWNTVKNHQPDSFMEIIKENINNKSHTLLLIDIGLGFEDSLRQIKESFDKHGVNEKVVVCSRMGTKEEKMYYGMIEELIEKEVKNPYCYVIPAPEESIHFMEKEALEMIKV